MALVLIRSAWISDDGFITLRTVSNFLDGNGLVFNLGERVQTYTHPLWMFIVSAAVFLSKEYFFTVMLISISLCIAAALKLSKSHLSPLQSGVFVISLLSSKAFVDYSTSGLENSLSYFLFAFLITACLVAKQSGKDSTSIFVCTTLFAMIVLTRHDLALIALPPLALTVVEAKMDRVTKLKTALAGLIPLIAWTGFALLYYGSPFPNTAYAKLTTEVPRPDLITQGIGYLLNSLNYDPVTIPLIAVGLFMGFKSSNHHIRAIMLGVSLYILYTIWIGGDFMSGRFLAVPLFICVFMFAKHLPEWVSFNLTEAKLIGAAIVVLSMSSVASPWRVNSTYPNSGHWQNGIGPGSSAMDGLLISDERAEYYYGTGLLTISKYVDAPISHRLCLEGKLIDSNQVRFMTVGAAGILPFCASRDIYFVDRFGLINPIMSRIPSSTVDPNAKVPVWRPGHFHRDVPCGLEESVLSGRNVVCDPSLAVFYEKMQLITQGDLLNLQRLKAIASLNLGRYDYLLDEYVRRSVKVDQSEK